MSYHKILLLYFLQAESPLVNKAISDVIRINTAIESNITVPPFIKTKQNLSAIHGMPEDQAEKRHMSNIGIIRKDQDPGWNNESFY